MKNKFIIQNSEFIIQEGGPARHARQPRRPTTGTVGQIAGVAGGQALVTLLFFVVIAVTITSGAVIMIIANATSTSKIQEGIAAYYVAESGIEDALMRLLRDPSSFSGGSETLSIEGTSSTAEVTVTDIDSTTKEVVSIGQNGNFKRTVQARMTYTNGYYTFTNWREI